MQKTRPWAILAAGAAIQILTGLPAAWGVFQQPVMEEYGLSEQGAGLAFGILIAAFGVGCVIGGFLQDRNGPRRAALWGTALLCGGFFAAALLPGAAGGWFWGLFSVPAGLGTAFLYPSIQSCAQKWYKGRKGLATGVIGGAVGLSGAFLTVFVRTALRGFGPVQGIRGAFWALGALTLPVCLVGSALLTDPPPEKPRPSQQGRGKAAPGLDLSPGQMLRTRQYWLCAGAVCCSTPAVLLFSPIILKLGMERGLDESAALWSVVLGSVGSAAGRLLMPMLSDKIGRRPTDMMLVCGLAGADVPSSGFAQGWAVVAVLRGPDVLLLGAGGGAARPLHRPVRLPPCRGQLWLSGPGTERGQPCVSVCSQSLGAGSRGGTWLAVAAAVGRICLPSGPCGPCNRPAGRRPQGIGLKIHSDKIDRKYDNVADRKQHELTVRYK